MNPSAQELNESQTESLLKEAIGARSWNQVSSFMVKTFGTNPGSTSGVYAQSVAKHADLLGKLLPEQRQSVMQFIGENGLRIYPELMGFLNVEQRAKMADKRKKPVRSFTLPVESESFFKNYPVVKSTFTRRDKLDLVDELIVAGLERTAAYVSSLSAKDLHGLLVKASPTKKFGSFDDAEEFLSEKLGDEYETDRQEYEIVEGSGGLSPLEFMKDAEGQLTKQGVFVGSKNPEAKKELYRHEAEERLTEQHGKDFFQKMSKPDQEAYLKVFPKSRFAGKVSSMLSKILAESDDRKAHPQNDVINEVQPLKWKKAPPGVHAPINMPMNPDAKKPETQMEGLPENKPAVKACMYPALASTLVRTKKRYPEIDRLLAAEDEEEVIELEEMPEIELEEPPMDDAPPADEGGEGGGAHEGENMEMLKDAFNRFVDEEMKESGEHDPENLEALKESFGKFLDEEMKEA